jgi:hypothetical protein
LLLDIENSKIRGYGVSGLVMISQAVCLLLFSLGKRVRITIIVVVLLVAVSSRLSRLKASYSVVVGMNGFGGLHYFGEYDKLAKYELTKSFAAKGHTLMHICSVLASMVYGIALVQFVCTS